MQNVEIKKSKKARHIRLSVHPGGRVVLTIPHRMSETVGLKFLDSKADWVKRAVEKVKSRPHKQPLKGSDHEFQQYKNKAEEYAKKRLAFYQTIYPFPVKKIIVRNQNTRWGSCSKSGTISLHYKIALIPKEFADYVIVHELCHVKEMNHSHRFWKLVEKTFPNYKEVRRELHKINNELCE